MKHYYLSPQKDQWKLILEKGERATKVFNTKEQGMEFSKNFMHNNGGSLHIKKMNGTFQEERTYPRKNDPSKSKG